MSSLDKPWSIDVTRKLNARKKWWFEYIGKYGGGENRGWKAHRANRLSSWEMFSQMPADAAVALGLRIGRNDYEADAVGDSIEQT